jgi:hypothetical protein
MLAYGLAPSPARAAETIPNPQVVPGGVHPGGGEVLRSRRADVIALRAIREDGQRQVDELWRAATALPAGPARQQMMKQIDTVKRDTWIRVLRSNAQFARARGDVDRAREFETALGHMLRPAFPALEPGARAVPEKPVKPEGGAR